ncbi:MAG: GAF domain-containing protein [Anaeromyxobacter sp.]|nr:GAF domain-containing protein [Anaeromyxobacter sp.]MBL0274505.1 GAF domain-containing protein [Anaeromyxobacter sp.]
MDGTTPPAGQERGAAAPPPGREVVERLRLAHLEALRALGAAVADTTRLTRLFTILGEPAPLEVLLERVLATLSELFSSDVVLLLQPAGPGEFAPLAAIGLPEDLLRRPVSAAPGSRLAAALAGRAPEESGEVQDDLAVDLHLRELGIRRAVWLPVVGAAEPLAVLCLARCRPAPFSRADVDLLRAMAYRIGLVLERDRTEASLREAQERLLQAEKLALAGRLAGSVAHEVNNPLAYLRANLQALQRQLPAVSATLEAARSAAAFLASHPAPEARQQGRTLLAAMGEEAGAELTTELAELVEESLDGVVRIGHLVRGFTRLAVADQPTLAGWVDLRALVAECLSELPGQAGGPGLVQLGLGGDACAAWVAPEVLKAALLGLLRFLRSPGHRRGEPVGQVVVVAERQQGRPTVVITDPSILLSDEQRRAIFDPRMEEVETPGGRTIRLSLSLLLSYQLLRGCQAELSATATGLQGLVIRIRLPAVPAAPA